MTSARNHGGREYSWCTEESAAQSSDGRRGSHASAGSRPPSRTEIRAPQTWRVHEFAVRTLGGVIGLAETIMLIVPEDDGLSVEVKVSPIQDCRVAQEPGQRIEHSRSNQDRIVPTRMSKDDVVGFE